MHRIALWALLTVFLATMALGLLELGGFDYAPHTAIATAEARCHEQTDRNLTCRSIVNLHDGTQLLSSLTEGLGPEVRDCWRWKSDSAEQQSSRAVRRIVRFRVACCLCIPCQRHGAAVYSTDC